MSGVLIGTAVSAVVSIGTGVYKGDQASIAAKSQANQELKLTQLNFKQQAEQLKQAQLAAAKDATTNILSAAQIEKNKEKTKRKIIIGISVVAGLVITVVSVLFIGKKKKTKTE